MRKYVSRFVSVSLCICAISILVYAVCINSSYCADLVNSTLSHGIRYILALASAWLPFSLFEVLIILSPVLLIAALVIAFRREGMVKKVRFLMTLIAIISIIFTSYIYTLGIGYRTSSLSEKTGIEAKNDLSAAELLYTANRVQEELNAIAENLTLTDGETPTEADEPVSYTTQKL